ncbi:hypothetical protein JWE07_27560, partial [Klebsiella pneumoniae]|uniref:hypothetical protein n=1 Tax=Klebsiella pneumoniae TaxID=573 RepID=UPI0022EA8E65
VSACAKDNDAALALDLAATNASSASISAALPLATLYSACAKAIPEKAENKSYAESMQNLKAALNAGKIDLQEYNAATEQMEQ